ncbi:sigma-54-dependent Fis family transcriptional regulator [bacterium]|nr:sigma-54-dependent Fis family transcriptional regulator [bacterium]
MEKFKEICLEVWREACRDIEIDKSCRTITQLLLDHMPLGQVLVLSLDTRKGFMEIVASGMDPDPDCAFNSPSEWLPDEMEQFRIFCERGMPVLRSSSPENRELIRILMRSEPPGDVLAGPLKNENAVMGLLVLIAGPVEAFTSQHAGMMQILLEPFSVALNNDRRLHQIMTLREAAEADKKSLLRKLSRKSLTDTIIGAESGLRQVMNRVHLVSRSDVPVMILGETGTGKELISREIHRLSSRSSGPFIRINCGSIPPELIDSQLFGHEKGAFTGAVATHKGWFERADGGTLFLDEIGELPPAGQVRLLRIIQDGWLERVGGRQPVHVDVRLVVATNRDLAEMIRGGMFREDLWYRLSVFPILLPSLRDRKDDIPELAVHFAERAMIRFNLPSQMPTERDLKLLRGYDWPGNIRELASVIDRAAILGDGHGLKLETALGPAGEGRETVESAYSGSTPAHFPSLDAVVTSHINSALKLARGRVEGAYGAASLLKIHPNTLRARMKKLNIDWTGYRGQEKEETSLA